MDRIRERSQAVRPHIGRNHPVTQSRPIVAARSEPTIVQDEALHTNLGREINQREQARQRMVEIDSLPRIQRDRPRSSGVLRPSPQPLMDAPSRLIQAIAPSRDKPRGLIGLSRTQDDLARHQQLATHQNLEAQGVPFCQRLSVARPRDVHVVDQSTTPSGCRLTSAMNARRSVSASHPQRPKMCADGELVGLNVPLAQMSPSLIDDAGLTRGGR